METLKNEPEQEKADQQLSPEATEKNYQLPINLEINFAKILSDPPEWIGNTIEINQKAMKSALLQWAETEDGKRVMELAKDYQECRKKILNMKEWRGRDMKKSSTFSKEDAEALMKRIQEIREQVGGKFTHMGEKGIEDAYHWILDQE